MVYPIQIRHTYKDSAGTIVRPFAFVRHAVTREDGVLWWDESPIKAGVHARSGSIEWFMTNFKLVDSSMEDEMNITIHGKDKDGKEYVIELAALPTKKAAAARISQVIDGKSHTDEIQMDSVTHPTDSVIEGRIVNHFPHPMVSFALLGRGVRVYVKSPIGIGSSTTDYVLNVADQKAVLAFMALFEGEKASGEKHD